eukprot:Rmarinus@m.12486
MPRQWVGNRDPYAYTKRVERLEAVQPTGTQFRQRLGETSVIQRVDDPDEAVRIRNRSFAYTGEVTAKVSDLSSHMQMGSTSTALSPDTADDAREVLMDALSSSPAIRLRAAQKLSLLAGRAREDTDGQLQLGVIIWSQRTRSGSFYDALLQLLAQPDPTISRLVLQSIRDLFLSPNVLSRAKANELDTLYKDYIQPLCRGQRASRFSRPVDETVQAVAKQAADALMAFYGFGSADPSGGVGGGGGSGAGVGGIMDRRPSLSGQTRSQDCRKNEPSGSNDNDDSLFAFRQRLSLETESPADVEDIAEIVRDRLRQRGVIGHVAVSRFFSLLDHDGAPGLSEQELLSGCREVGLRLSPQEMASLWKMVQKVSGNRARADVECVVSVVMGRLTGKRLQALKKLYSELSEGSFSSAHQAGSGEIFIPIATLKRRFVPESVREVLGMGLFKASSVLTLSPLDTWTNQNLSDVFLHHFEDYYAKISEQIPTDDDFIFLLMKSWR